MIPIAEKIWNEKYRFQQETLKGTYRRVAKALADNSGDEERFFTAMDSGRFIPAGRILAGAGTGRAVTLKNCFVMGTIPDSMEGIFQAVKEAALTMQQGGGIGYDFSTIRPKGELVAGVGADASGPLSFMDVWDSMCRTVMSAGSRRGAMMATLRCDHPDIEAFIEAKRDSKRLRMFNLSVLVTYEFLANVRNGNDHRLVWNGEIKKILPARDLWNRIMQATYDVAEPGVIFIDEINTKNNLYFAEKISATNPCGEQPLPPYGSCLLGSINLTELVRDPFTERASIDVELLKSTVAVAVRLLDRVIDVTNYPLPQQEEEARRKRRIGLGVTGLADALLMCGLHYDSKEGRNFAAKTARQIFVKSYRESCELAEKLGPAPILNSAEKREAFCKSHHVSYLSSDLLAKIQKFGVRNTHMTSIAPTGTISLFAGNVSSGIEPIFAAEYKRKVLRPDGTHDVEVTQDYAVALWRKLGNAGLPPNFVDAQSIDPSAHVWMQSAVQRWVDSAISKTINLPKEISFDDFKEVYWMAYQEGCKGCTTYRPNDVTGSVISVEEAEGKLPAVNLETTPASRKPVLSGQTYKLRWPLSPHALYITINDHDGSPFEIFFNSKNMEHYAWSIALARMVSAVFRRGGDISFVAEELRSVFDPKGGAWLEGTYHPSLVAAIGAIVERHMKGELEPARKINVSAGEATPLSNTSCSACGSRATVEQSGCLTCTACGHSSCG